MSLRERDTRAHKETVRWPSTSQGERHSRNLTASLQTDSHQLPLKTLLCLDGRSRPRQSPRPPSTQQAITPERHLLKGAYRHQSHSDTPQN